MNIPENYHYHCLPGGLVIVGQYMPSLSSVACGFSVHAGVVHEPSSQEGLAHVFGNMLLRGTEQKSARALTEAFEDLGVEKSVSVTMERTTISSKMVSSKLQDILPLLCEILFSPSFPESELEAVKQKVFQEMRRQQDEPSQRILELARQTFYLGSPLSRKNLGTVESVSALQHSDLCNFWKQYCHPANIVFSIAGKFDWDAVVFQLTTLFEGRESSPLSDSSYPVQTHSSIYAVDQQEGNQEHLALLSTLPKYGDPEYYVARVISEAFGGGMDSRLFTEVREKRGLVYSVAAMPLSYEQTGALLVYAGTTPAQAEECLQVMKEQYALLLEQGLTEDEISRAKVQLKSATVMQGEGSSARMRALLQSWTYTKELRTVEDVKRAIDAVDLAKVAATLAKFSPASRLTAIGIGPVEKSVLFAPNVFA